MTEVCRADARVALRESFRCFGLVPRKTDGVASDNGFLFRVRQGDLCSCTMGVSHQRVGRVWTVSIWQTHFCKGFPCCSYVLILWLFENEQELDTQETREPKFERLIPMMLLHKPQGSGSVGRDQLAHRADEFARGHWDSSLRVARQNLFNGSQHRELSKDEERIRRGVVAQSD